MRLIKNLKSCVAYIVFLLDSVGLTITEVWVVFKTGYRNQLCYQQKLGKYSKEIIYNKYLQT